MYLNYMHAFYMIFRKYILFRGLIYLWNGQKPLSMRCLFQNLNCFAQANTENKAMGDKWLLPEQQSSDIVVLSCTPGMKFFRRFLPFLFLGFLLISVISFKLFLLFARDSSFSKNLTQYTSKIKHSPIQKFGIKKHTKYWPRKMWKNCD